MNTSRRLFMAGTAGAGAALAAASTAEAKTSSKTLLDATDFGVRPGLAKPQTRALQKAIDAAIRQKRPMLLPGGTILTKSLRISGDIQLVGVAGQTNLMAGGIGALLHIEEVGSVSIDGVGFDGNKASPIANDVAGLVTASNVKSLRIERCTFTGSRRNGLSLSNCGGVITASTFSHNRDAGLFSIDSTGLTITENLVEDCENNGILIWQSKKQADGSIVNQNRIRRIGARDGGSGQNGNGINIYRAANVMAAHNTISKCAFSAVRCNAGDNVQIVGNNCSDLGETGLYVEFGFEGAVVNNNIVDLAAQGIAITNLNVGGRLAACSGNLVRNITRTRVNDTSGTGIGVDGDTAVTGNVIENVSAAGIGMGWGEHMQNTIATGNMIRDCNVGLEASTAKGAGKAVIANNIISGAKRGGVFGMNWEKVATEDLAIPGTLPPPNLTVSGNQLV